MIKIILDWAERRGNWWPFLAGFLTTLAVLAAMGASPWFWLPAAAGIAMLAIRPFGTTWRYRRLIREKQRLDRQLTAMTATLTVLGQIEQVLDRCLEMVRNRSGKDGSQ